MTKIQNNNKTTKPSPNSQGKNTVKTPSCKSLESSETTVHVETCTVLPTSPTNQLNCKKVVILTNSYHVSSFLSKKLDNDNIRIESFSLPNLKLNKAKYSKIYLLSDSPTAQQEAACNNIIWIDTTDARQYLGIEPTKTLQQIAKDKDLSSIFLKYCIGVNSMIKRLKIDPYSFDVPHCFNLEFSQYLGQKAANSHGIKPVDFLVHMIKTKHRVLAGMNAGTGKSTAQMSVVDSREKAELILAKLDKGFLQASFDNFKGHEINRIFIGVPTTPLADQLCKGIEEKGLNVVNIQGKSSKEDIEEVVYHGANFVVFVYDSISKIKDQIKDNVLLVIDEIHSIGTDFNFRSKKKYRLLCEVLENTKYVLGLSATPDYKYAWSRSVHPLFGFTLVNGMPLIQGEIKIIPTGYGGRRKDIFPWILKKSKEKEGLCCVKFDSKKESKLALELFNKEGVNTDFFHSNSKDECRKLNNDNYNSLMDTGKMSKELRMLIFTTLLEAGVSIKDLCSYMILVDVRAWQKAIQILSRPRYNHSTGVNEIIEVLFMCTEESYKKEMPVLNRKTGLNRFNELLKLATDLCHVKNNKTAKTATERAKTAYLESIKDKKKYSTKSDNTAINFASILNENTGNYEPCIVNILHQMYNEEQDVNFKMTLERIKHFDNRVTIEDPVFIELTKSVPFEEQRGIEKEAKEVRKQKAANLFINDFEKMAFCVASRSKNVDFIDKMKDFFKFPNLIKGVELEYKSSNSDAFDCGGYPNKILGYIHSFKSHFPNYSISDIAKLVTRADSKFIDKCISQFGRTNRHKAITNDNDNIHEDDLIHFDTEYFIRSKISKYKKNIQQGSLKSINGFSTAEQLTKVVNNALKSVKLEGKKIGQTVTKQRAIAILKDLYNVKTKRAKVKRKLITVHQVNERIKSKTLNEEIGELIDKFCY